MKKLLVLLLAACGSGTSGPPTDTITVPAADSCVCIAMGADYTNKVGTTNVIGLPSGTVASSDLFHGSASGDPVVRATDDHTVFVINRFGFDSITELTKSGDVWTEKAQFSTGMGSNPQDIAVVGTNAYVVALGVGAIQIYDLTRDPVAQTGTIDLSSLDSDGNPDAQSIFAGGDGQLYATLEFLDSEFHATQKGAVVQIDPTTKKVGKKLDLNYEDPYGFLTPTHDGKLQVGTEDDFSGVTGCLERVSMGSDPKVDNCVAQNGDLGGTISALAEGAGTTTWVAVTAFGADGSETGKLLPVDATGTIGTAVSTADEVPTDVAFCAGANEVVFADQKSGTLHVFDATSMQEKSPITLSLTPANAGGIVCLPR